MENAYEPYELPDGVGAVDRAGIVLAPPSGVAEPALAQNVKGLSSVADVATRQPCPPALLHAAIASFPALSSDLPHPTPALVLSELSATVPQAFRNHRTSWQVHEAVQALLHAATALSRAADRLVPLLPAAAPHTGFMEYAIEPYSRSGVILICCSPLRICFSPLSGGVGLPLPPQATRKKAVAPSTASVFNGL